MSDDTYYAVLGIPESATQAQIKGAYRDLIRQVHPDSVPNASPYWKRAAEERSKELNEAYHVLIDPDQRSSYDEQLARYRRKAVTVPRPSSPLEVEVTPAPNPVPRQQTHKRGYNWQPLKRWAGRYPLLACCLGVLILVPMISLFTGLKQNRAAINTDNASAFEGVYSAYPCLDPRDAVSPIDGKPCRKPEGTTPAPEATDAKPLDKHGNAAARPVTALNSWAAPCDGRETVSDLDHTPCKAAATAKWFYIASDGIHPLGGEPDGETCTRISAKNLSACRASLKYCPRGVWAKDCVSYSRWKKNVDPPRQEKWIPAWPSL
jgi:curved DNA-binding protein CbpA